MNSTRVAGVATSFGALANLPGALAGDPISGMFFCACAISSIYFLTTGDKE